MKHPIRKKLTQLRNYLKRRNVKLFLESEYEERIEEARREGAREQRKKCLEVFIKILNRGFIVNVSDIDMENHTAYLKFDDLGQAIINLINAELKNS